MASSDHLAWRRMEAFGRALELVELDTPIPSTKASALDQQVFEAAILAAIVERLPKKRAPHKPSEAKPERLALPAAPGAAEVPEE